MKSPMVAVLLLVLASGAVKTDDWLDGKFELSQIEQTATVKLAGNEAGKLKQKLNDGMSSKQKLDAGIKSEINSEVNNEVTGEIIKSTDGRLVNTTNRIDDFELNASQAPSDAPNATLSAKQPRLFSIGLDPDHLLTLFWTVNHEQRHILFELKLSLPNQVSAPFLAFGFSAYGAFENADLCVLWEDEKSRFHFQDTWTDANGFLNLDKQNDCELLSTKKVGNQIYLLFKRKFNTCDSHDFKLTKGTNHLLYALGNGQLEAVYGLRLATIKRKGFARVSLFKSRQIPPLLNPGRMTVEQ